MDNAYIERLLRHLQTRVAQDQFPLIEQFARLFWARALEEDLASRDVSDDAGATLEAFRRLRERRDAEIAIHLLNPVSARNGWHSSHSVVIVTAPNMPFMVDSVLMALSHDGLATHHLGNAVFAVDRDAQQDIVSLSDTLQHPHRELLIYAEIDRLEDAALTPLHSKLQSMAEELAAVVADFSAMKGRVDEIVAGLRNAPPPLPAEEIEEGIAYLEWLTANHFTFLGYREFAYADGLIQQTGPALGMQRVRRVASERKLADQPQLVQDFLMKPALLSFSKSGTKSQVHRPAYPDYVGIKRFDANGAVIGEVGLLGLYTSRVYMEQPENIPVVRRKTANVLHKSGLDLNGFDGKVLAQVLATYPRDELFQISEAELFETAMVITDIHERRRVRVFARYDAYGLFVNTLVYMPRDLFTTAIRVALTELLVETFDAEDAEHDIFLSESILVRVQIILRVPPSTRTDVDRIALEKRIADMIGDWNSELHEALVQHFGEAQGRALHAEYEQAFPAGYRERFEVRAAIDDVSAIQKLSVDADLSTQFYRLPEDPDERLRLKIFHLGQPLPLSDVVPKLENMGLRVIGEHPYAVKRAEAEQVSVHDYELHYNDELDLGQAEADFDAAFVRIWQGIVEDDPFNRLILAAGLGWRQVSVLRAYSQYMKQIRFGFSQFAISDALFSHQQIARDLVTYFEQRFAPQVAADSAAAADTKGRILAALDAVVLLNEDRILRRFLEIMDATLRTNYYVEDEHSRPRAYLSLKFQPAKISNMPQPRPVFEVFVSAPHVEGVHLRGGPIARGGLRWSDRREDYRTEVLGLVKAQVVKNAVIVPTGAKGGFVCKSDVEGVACYQDFIRGLLDITDNIVAGEVQRPAGVYAHDADDPYLVVAADKGTATFSDVANAVAADYAFWLGDAFASGGSNGYDHKKMGITARGAWVSVQRHFAERDIDVQTESITVLGIGDMAGDVFGNGMLLSPCLKLVAAFNHKHIFIDPDPDVAASYAERQRLFEQPGSAWSDYDASLISDGGGVFSRADKSIAISQPMAQLFDLSEATLAPDELIHALLKSPVQLIWNGGIGTYVKASHESHDAAGDRTNDHLRVDACELRCQAFGEGGNLGMTQPARIEFALGGGAVNTDFIDNSAGVDCSDHEVNIKIALNEAVSREDMTRKQRNELLEGMTDAVADLVLANNHKQSQTLSLATRHVQLNQGEYQRLLDYLAQHAGLDRALEFLPSNEALLERYDDGHGLTRPEMAVLLAYAKIHIKGQLGGSDMFADELIAKRVFSAFPAQLVERHADSLRAHRLAPQIIATQLANEIVDHLGISFTTYLIESAGANVVEIARAFAVVTECFGLAGWYQQIRQAAGVASETQLQVLLELIRLGRRSARWMLRHTDINAPLQPLIDKFQGPVTDLLGTQPGQIGERVDSWRQRKQQLMDAGMPEELAQKSALAAESARLLPLIDVAHARGCDITQLAELTELVGHELHIDWLANRLMDVPTSSHWQVMERESLLDDLFTRQSLLSALVIEHGGGDLPGWLQTNERFFTPWLQTLDEARHTTQIEFSMYATLVRKLGDLTTRSSGAATL